VRERNVCVKERINPLRNIELKDRLYTKTEALLEGTKAARWNPYRCRWWTIEEEKHRAMPNGIRGRNAEKGGVFPARKNEA